MPFDVDEKLAPNSLGPAATDVQFVLILDALAVAPTAAEQTKLTAIKSHSHSTRLDALVDQVLARAV